MENELPEVLYVVRRNDIDDDTFWFSAEEEISTLAERGETKIVGVYELKKKVSVTLEVKEEVIVDGVVEYTAEEDDSPF